MEVHTPMMRKWRRWQETNTDVNINVAIPVHNTDLITAWEEDEAEIEKPLTNDQRKDIERALKLALVGALPDGKIGYLALSEYLLFTLNRFRSRKYLELCGLPPDAPAIEDVEEVLRLIAKRNNGCDENAAGSLFVSKYRKGELGKFTLEYVFSLCFAFSNMRNLVISPLRVHWQ